MQIVVRGKVPEDKIKQWAGKHPTKDHYDFVIDGNCSVRNHLNQPVVTVVRGGLSKEAIELAHPTLAWMQKFKSDNRGNYAGAQSSGGIIKKDGSKSKQSRALDANGKRLEIESCIAGYYERQGGRFPYCRTTAITRNHPEQWKTLLPVMAEAARIYRKRMPERYKAQMKFVNDAHHSWIIPNTPFTTITVNNSVAAAYHQDGGDLKQGFGAMLVLTEGQFDGFELVVPEYRLAVKMRHGDLLLFNPVIWHGNIPPYNTVGEKNKDWRRISLVMYYREGILGCDSPEKELEKAKSRGAL